MKSMAPSTGDSTNISDIVHSPDAAVRFPSNSYTSVLGGGRGWGAYTVLHTSQPVQLHTHVHTHYYAHTHTHRHMPRALVKRDGPYGLTAFTCRWHTIRTARTFSAASKRSPSGWNVSMVQRCQSSMRCSTKGSAAKRMG